MNIRGWKIRNASDFSRSGEFYDDFRISISPSRQSEGYVISHRDMVTTRTKYLLTIELFGYRIIHLTAVKLDKL